MDPIMITGVLGVATLVVLVLALLKIVALGKLVHQLSEKIPGTGMTAKELADELGESIDQAFSKYVPKPEQLASALREAVDTAGKNQLAEAEKLSQAIAESSNVVKESLASAGKELSEPLRSANQSLVQAIEAVGKKQAEEAQALNKALSDSATGIKEGLATAGAEAAASLDGARKSLLDAAGSLTAGFEASAGKFQAVFSGHADEIQNALQGVGGTWSEQISGALSEHAQKLTEANASLAAELNKIASLEKDIVKLLHVQEVIEGTVKEIAASEEFKSTLEGLRTHLQESDKLLREAAKPRTIRLVESEDEIVQA